MRTTVRVTRQVRARVTVQFRVQVTAQCAGREGPPEQGCRREDETGVPTRDARKMPCCRTLRDISVNRNPTVGRGGRYIPSP